MEVTAEVTFRHDFRDLHTVARGDAAHSGCGICIFLIYIYIYILVYAQCYAMLYI